MIYYFSATGNSLNIANRLCKLLNEPITNITHETRIDRNQKMIFVVPCYFWGIPDIVVNLLNNEEFNKNDNLYFVITCGGFLGTTDKIIKNIIKPAKLFIYQLPMETNYIVWHKIDNKEVILKKLNDANEKINEIAKDIQNNKSTYKSIIFIRFLEKIMYKQYDKQRKTKKFYVNDTCISCSLCEKNCPDKAIELKEGKPVWIKEKCQHCLRCLHHCPTLSIEYGKETVGRERYLYSNYLKA